MRLRYISLFLALIFLCFGCSSDREDEERFDIESELSKAWKEYDLGNNESSVLAFEKVISAKQSPDTASDAYNGIGWVYLRFSQSVGVNQKNVVISINKFEEAIKLDENNADAYVGMACALLIKRGSDSDLRNAIVYADKALNINNEKLYRHDYDSESDLRILKAQCYFYLNELDKAKSEIEIVINKEKDDPIALAMMDIL
ncbi:MAG: hypothetical protein ACUVWN_07175 [bacterium]